VVGRGPRSGDFLAQKSGKPRTVPLLRQAQEALQTAKEHGAVAYPFRFRYNTFQKDWAAARRSSGLADDRQVVPHTLRHTFASRLIQKGVDIVRVQQWLGHSSLHLTLRYAHLAPSDLFDIAAILDAPAPLHDDEPMTKLGSVSIPASHNGKSATDNSVHYLVQNTPKFGTSSKQAESLTQ
jgi:integrase